MENLAQERVSNMLRLREYTEESIMEMAVHDTDFLRVIAEHYIITMTDEEVLDWNGLKDRSAYQGQADLRDNTR